MKITKLEKTIADAKKEIADIKKEMSQAIKVANKKVKDFEKQLQDYKNKHYIKTEVEWFLGYTDANYGIWLFCAKKYGIMDELELEVVKKLIENNLDINAKYQVGGYCNTLMTSLDITIHLKPKRIDYSKHYLGDLAFNKAMKEHKKTVKALRELGAKTSEELNLHN